MVGRFVWWDLMTIDLEKTAIFMAELFGYELAERPIAEDASYLTFTPKGSDEALFGLIPIEPDDGARTHWIGYLAVEDVDTAVATVEDAGGTVHFLPEMTLDEDGEVVETDLARFAVVTDPQGAVFAPYLPDPDAPPPKRGVGRIGWVELTTSDRDGASAFYGDLVGWTAGPDAPLGDAVQGRALQQDGAPVGIVRDLLVGSAYPPHWEFYIQVADLDATIEKARALGGYLYEDPVKLPNGRRATLVEPSGAPVSIWQPS